MTQEEYTRLAHWAATEYVSRDADHEKIVQTVAYAGELRQVARAMLSRLNHGSCTDCRPAWDPGLGWWLHSHTCPVHRAHILLGGYAVSMSPRKEGADVQPMVPGSGATGAAPIPAQVFIPDGSE